MSSVPGIGPIVWEALYRMGQTVTLDGKERVAIVGINPIGGDSAKYSVRFQDGRTEDQIREQRLRA